MHHQAHHSMKVVVSLDGDNSYSFLDSFHVSEGDRTPDSYWMSLYRRHALLFVVQDKFDSSDISPTPSSDHCRSRVTLLCRCRCRIKGEAVSVRSCDAGSVGNIGCRSMCVMNINRRQEVSHLKNSIAYLRSRRCCCDSQPRTVLDRT